MAEVEARGLTVHVQHLGEGDPPVIFIHGLVMDNLSSWFFTVAAPASQGHRVLLYDLRGHGRTTSPAEGYTLDDFVADLHAVRTSTGLTQPAVLVGNSFGGLLALAYAAAHPGSVAGLALVDALLPEKGWGDAMVSTLGLQGEDRDRQIATSFQHWLGRHSGRKRNRLAKQARRLVEQTSLLDDTRSSPGMALEALSVIEAPVLAIYGADSDVRPAGERLAGVLPRCELVILDGCTHSVLWERTAEVRDRILAFLDGVS